MLRVLVWVCVRLIGCQCVWLFVCLFVLRAWLFVCLFVYVRALSVCVLRACLCGVALRLLVVGTDVCDVAVHTLFVCVCACVCGCMCVCPRGRPARARLRVVAVLVGLLVVGFVCGAGGCAARFACVGAPGLWLCGASGRQVVCACAHPVVLVFA